MFETFYIKRKKLISFFWKSLTLFLRVTLINPVRHDYLYSLGWCCQSLSTKTSLFIHAHILIAIEVKVRHLIGLNSVLLVYCVYFLICSYFSHVQGLITVILVTVTSRFSFCSIDAKCQIPIFDEFWQLPLLSRDPTL